LVFLGRFGTYQRVTREKNKKFFRSLSSRGGL
jgi:hypothetical protein